MRQTPNSTKKGETMKAYGMTAQELRDLADAVAIVEEASGARLESDIGGVLGFYYNEGGTRPVDVAIARIALALGDDRPEFHEMIQKGGN